MSVLSVNDLGKAYRTYSSEWHRLGRLVGLPLRPLEEAWVLRHVSFDIGRGEAVGIIGQNGAGKSTLLKLITGTLAPSEGHVHIAGRIGAILELGMGFHPEMSGRQNARMAAGLMGYNADQIEQAMPDIEDFAEVGEYFDEPVRTYSSGMQVRVAFSVATVFKPEILIVDEALAVGDAYFQHKCFDRIREFRENGMTLLIVSHNRGSVQALCDRAILLEKGLAIREGPPEEVFDFYNATLADTQARNVFVDKSGDRAKTRSGTGEARVSDITLLNSKGEETEYVSVGETVRLRVRVEVVEDLELLVFGFGIRDRLGQTMYGTNTWHTEQTLNKPRAGEIYEFIVTFPANLGVGSYSVQTALTDRDTHLNTNYEWQDLALVFNVINTDKPTFVGCQWYEPVISVERRSGER